MSEYLETYFDPDFGTIAAVREGKDGPIIATAASWVSKPRIGHANITIIDEVQVFGHGYLLPPELWDKAAE